MPNILNVFLITDEEVRTIVPAVFSDTFQSRLKSHIDASKPREVFCLYSPEKLTILRDKLQTAGGPVSSKDLVEAFGICFPSALICKLRKFVEKDGWKLKKTTQGYLLERQPQSS